jgi:gamma-glutamyl hercynylcysteine S-oxide synthase
MIRRVLSLAFEHRPARWAVAGVAALIFVEGLWWEHAAVSAGGAVALCMVLRRISIDSRNGGGFLASWRRRRGLQHRAQGVSSHANSGSASRSESGSAAGRPRQKREPSNQPKNTASLVDDMLATGRYALLLRPETKRHLSQLQVVRAIRELDAAMALVPAGRVLLGQLAEQSNSTCGAADIDPKLAQRNLVNVEPAYLDRFCVTSEQYQQFIDGGGYEQLEYWHEEALPALLDFVDQTGAPGPRYWHDGQFAAGEGQLPVVGISWYEASAYARWVGKRLPTDAEWTKAGAWPVESSPGRIAQRRYPWGESFDVRRAHLYGSGKLGPVAVDEYPGGTSVGGIHQLIGNVWEWTDTPLVELGDPTLHISEAVISIRGGAYDTYFENQATCHFQSGEHPLSRRPNIGFRLALAMSDLEVSQHDGETERAADKSVAAAPKTSGVAAKC